MKQKKKIPCRVCKKLFEPCAYCQSHSDVFRWRNFACSKECAQKYIRDTLAYRNARKLNDQPKEPEAAKDAAADTHGCQTEARTE